MEHVVADGTDRHWNKILMMPLIKKRNSLDFRVTITCQHKTCESPLGKQEMSDDYQQINGMERKSGVPEDTENNQVGKAFHPLYGALCKPGVTSVTGLRLGWIELRGSSLFATVNFGLGLESLETQSPQNNVRNKTCQFQDYLQGSKAKTSGQF